MLKIEPEIVVKLEDIDSTTFGIFGNGGSCELEEQTGSEVYRDVKV